MERYSLNLDSLPVDIMSENARRKYTEVFTKQNNIAENGKTKYKFLLCRRLDKLTSLSVWTKCVV